MEEKPIYDSRITMEETDKRVGMTMQSESEDLLLRADEAHEWMQRQIQCQVSTLKSTSSAENNSDIKLASRSVLGGGLFFLR